MRKSRIVHHILIVFSVLMFLSFQSHAEEPEPMQEGEALYRQYESVLKELDREREEVAVFTKGWEELEGEHREFWSTGHFVQQRIAEGSQPIGVLAAQTQKNGSLSLKIVVGEEDSRTWLYQERGDVLYIACSMPVEGKPDLPEYIFNVWGSFWQSNAQMFSPEGHMRWAEPYREKWEKRIEFPEEWLFIGEEIYRIQRSEQRLEVLPPGLEEYLPRWVHREASRVRQELLETTEERRKVESLLEKRKNDMVEFACGDMNQDGRLDYAVELRWESEEREDWYPGDFWIFLSEGDSYRREVIFGISYWYSLTFRFIQEGILEVSFYSNEPRDPDYHTYYRYSQETGEFEFYRLYQKIQDANSGILIHTPHTIGKHTAEEFYSSGISSRIRAENLFYGGYDLHPYPGRSVIIHNSIGYCDYTGRRFEYFILDGIKKLESLVASRGEESIWSYMTYVTPRCFSGSVEGRGLLMDRRSGERIDVTELIPLEEMLEICRRGIKDESGRLLTELKQELCLLVLEKYYDRVNKPELPREGDDTELSMEITHWGVKFTRIGTGEEGERIWDSFFVDKEHFYHTPLWYYLGPEEDPAAEAGDLVRRLEEEEEAGEYREYWEEAHVTWKDETEELWKVKDYSFSGLSHDLTTTNPYWEGEALKGWLKARQEREGLFMELLLREREEGYWIRYRETEGGTLVLVERSKESSELPLFLLGEVELYRDSRRSRKRFPDGRPGGRQKNQLGEMKRKEGCIS